jgi:hypothetical protein
VDEAEFLAEAAALAQKNVERVLDRVQDLTDLGFAVVPLEPGKKYPTLKGWPRTRICSREEAEKHFIRGIENIGVAWGEASGGLIDVDIDDDVALALADHFLPKTGLEFGRDSRPRSHRVYRPVGTLKTMHNEYVEVLAKGTQSMAPGSKHPCGEKVRFDNEDKPASPDADTLVKGLWLLRAATHLAKHWPEEGHRHNAVLALAGGLKSLGMEGDAIRTFVEAICDYTGDDETDDRDRAVEDTIDRDDDQETAGFPTLAQKMDPKAVEQAKQWVREGLGQDAAGGEDAADDDVEVFTVGSKITIKNVSWIWPGYVLAGYLNNWDGDGGTGKSTSIYNIAARVSTNRKMPDGSVSCFGEARDIVVLSEDGAGDNVLPKFVAARGDRNRMHILTADLSIPSGLKKFER